MLSKLGVFRGLAARITVAPRSTSAVLPRFSSFLSTQHIHDEKKAFIEAVRRPGAVVCVGDYPDGPLYEVRIDGQLVAGIDDWPKGLTVPKHLLTFLNDDVVTPKPR